MAELWWRLLRETLEVTMIGWKSLRIVSVVIALLGLSALAIADGSSVSCTQVKPAAIPGQAGYLVATCCSKGCGGRCCRCGSATGWKPGCTVQCTVGAVDDDAVTVSLTPKIIVHGRLVHVETGQPLSGEHVSLRVPGGRTFETK